jgi:hypothetical protein
MVARLGGRAPFEASEPRLDAQRALAVFWSRWPTVVMRNVVVVGEQPNAPPMEGHAEALGWL